MQFFDYCVIFGHLLSEARKGFVPGWSTGMGEPAGPVFDDGEDLEPTTKLAAILRKTSYRPDFA